MDLLRFKNLIDGNPMHIATVNSQNNPNLSVASDVKVIGENQILISINEMVNTQENVKYNSNVVLTTFDKDWKGLKIHGTAIYYTEGDYYDMCMKNFFANGEITPFGASRPKGAMLVIVTDCTEFV